MKLAKLILKCIVLVVLWIIGIGLILSCTGSAASILDEMGRSGALFYLFIIAVLSPVVSSMVIVGILGGLWIGQGEKIGFIIASVLALIQLVGVVLPNKHVSSFDIQGVIMLIGIPAIIFSGGLTYMGILKWKAKWISSLSKN